MNNNILAGFILIATVTLSVHGQELDQDCNPIAVPPECVRLSESVRAIEIRITRMQERLNGASPAAKPDLIRTIRRLRSERDAVKADFTRCLRENGPPTRQLAPSELNARFTGTAALRTNARDARGPFAVDIDVEFHFSRNRCIVTVTSFPAIKFKTDPIGVLGRIGVVVTKTGGGKGTFHPVSGTMTLGITLHFHYETILASDDDATFYLTTDRSRSDDGTFDVTGSPLNADNRMRLVGTTRFRNGYLEGKYGSLVITANLSPRP